MTRIRQEEDLCFSASIRGQKLVYSSIADLGINPNHAIGVFAGEIREFRIPDLAATGFGELTASLIRFVSLTIPSRNLRKTGLCDFAPLRERRVLQSPNL
jgi:hypothetical protein